MSKNQRLGLAALAVVLAAAAFVVLRPTDESSTERRPTPARAPADDRPRTPADRPEAKPQPAVDVIRVRDGRPVGGPRKLAFTSGETARIDVSSDAPGEVHLHGYDIERRMAPGRPARLRFQADIEGVFELEDHESGAQLATVEVGPR
jgi:hypothetical protein